MILEILLAIFQAVGVAGFYLFRLVMMGIIVELCGKQFWLAFCEAKDVTRAIKIAARISIRNAASADFSFHYRIVMNIHYPILRLFARLVLCFFVGCAVRILF